MIRKQFRHEKWCSLEAVWIEEEGEAAVEVVVVAVAKGYEVDGRFGVELNVREFPV